MPQTIEDFPATEEQNQGPLRFTIDRGGNLPAIEAEAKPNEFLMAIAELDKGQLLVALESELQEVVASVIATSKQGSLTLKITVKPEAGAKPGEGEALFLEPVIDTKKPTFDRAAAVFFAEPDGSLSRQNPAKPRFHS